MCVRMSTGLTIVLWDHSPMRDCVALFLYLKVLAKAWGLGDGAVQGRGGRRPERGGGLAGCCLRLSVRRPLGRSLTPGAPLTLSFSVFLKIPCVPAAVAADLNKRSGNANGQVLLATGASPRRACGAKRSCPGAEIRVAWARKSPSDSFAPL